MCVYMYVCKSIYIYICACMHACMHVSTYTYTYTYIYIVPAATNHSRMPAPDGGKSITTRQGAQRCPRVEPERGKTRTKWLIDRSGPDTHVYIKKTKNEKHEKQYIVVRARSKQIGIRCQQPCRRDVMGRPADWLNQQCINKEPGRPFNSELNRTSKVIAIRASEANRPSTHTRPVKAIQVEMP